MAFIRRNAAANTAMSLSRNFVFAVIAGCQVITAQHHCVIIGAGCNKQAQRQKHHRQKHGLVAPAVFQRQPAQRRIHGQVGKAPGIQLPQCPQTPAAALPPCTAPAADTAAPEHLRFGHAGRVAAFAQGRIAGKPVRNAGARAVGKLLNGIIGAGAAPISWPASSCSSQKVVFAFTYEPGNASISAFTSAG